jgi:hypothetical protein
MFVLAVALATASAQPAQPQPAPAVFVEKAREIAKLAEQKVAKLIPQRAEVNIRWDGQLKEVDRLKKQKASWRRDRELNKAQADAADTGKRLTVLDNQIKAAQQELAKARTAVVIAIDNELKAGATGARAEQLAKLRAQLAPATPPRKIVIPNADIDPLADPEELERQAAALMAVEKQLESQRKGLDEQHKELKLVAELRSAHDRAGELSIRDDDQPHRGAQKSTRGGGEVSAAPESQDSAGGAGGGSGSGGSPTGGGGGGGDDSIGGENFGSDKSTTVGSFESSTVIALGEVIDKSTIEGLSRASRSGDPKQRAEAAKLARDAVAKRLEQLRQKRKDIEKRAKQLRTR